ncbi:hypothetical protein DCC79_00375 [bacterium]|nr:hypothetical protein [Chloroflexi bacterium CFX6]RIL12718.1 MAG: hypothetical protein DCC79_00375 [bacterium]
MLTTGSSDFQAHERPAFFNGQRLLASDLQAVEIANREMRWLHNRSLHQVGIGSGLAIVGNKGDRVVTVMAGYAIDDLGREIVLTEAVQLALPPVAGAGKGTPAIYDLTINYADDDDLNEAETRATICAQSERGAVRLREAPALCWVLVKTEHEISPLVKSGRRILLGRVRILNCELFSLEIDRRRNARPSKQPYIACGVANPVAWTPWTTKNDKGSDIIIGLCAEIDTSTARFGAVPCYTVRIDGKRPLDWRVNAYVHSAFDGPVTVFDPRSDGFTVGVLLMEIPPPRPAQPIEVPPGGGLNVVREVAMPAASAATPAATGAAVEGVSMPSASVAAPSASITDALRPVFSPWSVVWMGVEG